MKLFFKRLFQLLLIAFIGIQFIRPAKNVSDTKGPNDISVKYPVPADVEKILKTACYDCHSNNTVYPWYSHIQPVTWWLDKHIRDGKKDLNFSEFTTYSARRQYRKLEEVGELAENGGMPLSSYTLIHRDAKLSPEQKATLTGWVNALRDSIKQNYPPDSLLKRK